MRCYFCNKEACAKVGHADINICKIFSGGKVLNKKELYICKYHYDKYFNDTAREMRKYKVEV